MRAESRRVQSRAESHVVVLRDGAITGVPRTFGGSGWRAATISRDVVFRAVGARLRIVSRTRDSGSIPRAIQRGTLEFTYDTGTVNGVTDGTSRTGEGTEGNGTGPQRGNPRQSKPRSELCFLPRAMVAERDQHECNCSGPCHSVRPCWRLEGGRDRGTSSPGNDRAPSRSALADLCIPSS